jgi:TRAP-type C4-dicarboxylate transport system substrate-binding protein
LYDVKVFEIGKLCTLTNHSYTGGFLMMSEKAWKKLSEKDRAIVNAGISECQRFERKLAAEAQTKTLEMVKRKLGVTVFPIDTKPLQEAVSPMYKKFAKDMEGGMELIDQIIKTP